MIYIGLYHGRSFVSRLIEWRTWEDESHASRIYPGGAVVEAWAPKVQYRDSYHDGHTPGTRIDIYALAARDEVGRAFDEFLHAQIGKRYDYRGVAGFLIRRDIDRAESWFCSELMMAASTKAGVPLLARIAPHKVSPGMLKLSPLLTYVGCLVTGDRTFDQLSIPDQAAYRAGRIPITLSANSPEDEELGI